MICPRCADEHIEVMANSPVKGVWTVYQCQHCLMTHRWCRVFHRCWQKISANQLAGCGFALPGLHIAIF